jgi:hypothetical protein
LLWHRCATTVGHANGRWHCHVDRAVWHGNADSVRAYTRAIAYACADGRPKFDTDGDSDVDPAMLFNDQRCVVPVLRTRDQYASTIPYLRLPGSRQHH